MTTYHPSARVRLVLRAEEFGETAGLEARLPPAIPNTPASGATTTPTSQASTTAPDDSAEQALARNTERRTELEGRRAALSAEEYDRQIAQLDEERAEILRRNAPTPEDEGAQPEAISGTPPDDLTVIGEIEPRKVDIDFNGLASADTASLTLDFIDAPIDPRLLRAASVEITVGIVQAGDYEAGMTRGQRRPDGSLTSLVSRDDGGVVARFVGFIDDWTVEYSDQGDTVRVTCRDMSALLRDIKLPPGVSIDLSLPLDQGVTQLLNTASAATRGVTVRYLAEGDPPVPQRAAPRRRRGRRGRANRRARRGDQNMTLWDHITDVVRSQGLLPMVRDYELLITDPRTLYTALGVRRMVYGRNLERLEFNRKLSGIKTPTIEVRCLDAERGRTIWGRYPVPAGQPTSGVLGVDNPPAPRRANIVPPSGSNPDEAIRVMSISGVTDPAVLARHARSVYEELGRQEIEGTFTTRNAWSYDGSPQAPDLLTMRPGDSVTLLVARAQAGGENAGSDTSLARLEAMDRARRISYMQSLGWPISVAARFADLQDAAGFQTTFRVRDVRLGWDSNQGLEFTVGFMNYITIRDENADGSEA